MAADTPATLDVTAADDALRRLYSKRRVKYLGYVNNTLLAMLPKDEAFYGKSKEVPLWFGGNQGRSRTFSSAQNNKRPGKYKAFFVTRVSDYALGSIGTEAMLASENDDAAFLNLAKSEIDGTIRTASNNLGMAIYRNSGGARGQVSSIATKTVTLTNARDVVFFEIGAVFVNSTTDGTSGSVGSFKGEVTAVDRRAGTVTFDGVTNLSANDYLFQEGDFGLSMSGLADWIPAVAPSAGDNFFGVDRSVDTRLYGQYLDLTSGSYAGISIQEGLERADELIYNEGGALSHIVFNPLDFGKLRTSLGANVVYDKVRSPDEASISFSTIKVAGLANEIQCMADRNCPENIAWGLTMDSWELCTLKGGPRVLQGKDGLKFLWDYNADSMEIRVGMYGNLVCYEPNRNIQIKLA